MIGASGGKPLLSRIDTSNGGHGGYRGVEVTGTGSSAEIVVHGSITGSPVILHDSADSQITLRTRGSYDVYVAAFDAADGTGKWAMDGGGGGLDYFFAFSSDPDTHDIYVGGAVYNTPEYFQWGDVKRKNAHRQYAPSSEISGYVSTQKAFVAKLKSTTTLPTCLTTCSVAFGKPQASDVKAGHCYINRFCYKEGEFSPYADHGCMKCDPTMDAMEWSGPVTTSSCFIGNKCIASVSGTAYSPVAEKGCKLDMATFTAACYDDQGNMTMTETDKVQLMADKASMMTDAVANKEKIATHADTIKGLETSNIELAADLKTAKADNDGEKMPTWAIAIIVVIGAMFLLVVVILGVIVSREQQGKPVFVPSAMKKSVGAA